MTTRPAFFYDLGSPYAWLAAERVDALFPDGIAWVPVLLGGIFRVTGRSSWAGTPDRAAGIAEVERRARERGLPQPRWPDPWPNDGLAAMRAATCAHAEQRGRPFALAAFRLQFTEGRPLSDPVAIATAARRAGLDPRATLAATTDPDVKQALREATDHALALGVTGIPTVVAGGAVHWGDDALERAVEGLRHRRVAR